MKALTILFASILIAQVTFGQGVGVGTATPHTSAILDMQSTTKGVLLPRMTTVQRNAIVTPASGLMILNLDDQCIDQYDGTNWIKNCGIKITGTDTMPDAWTQKQNFGGSAREGAVGFTIGAKGYMGTGFDGMYKNDLWEYDPGPNTWTQKADLPGPGRKDAVGMAIHNTSNGQTRGYIGTGATPNHLSDWLEYNATTNAWTIKASLGAPPRADAVGFVIGSNYGYVGTGRNATNWLDDFWRYDVISNVWIQTISYPYKCHSATAFAANGHGYVGTGWRIGIPPFIPDQVVQDFYEFIPDYDWIPEVGFPGGARYGATGFVCNQKLYLGLGTTVNGILKKDVWEFSDDSWTQRADFSGTERKDAVGFSINNKGYIGTGHDGALKQDFWVYDPHPIGNVYNTPAPPAPAFSVSDGTWTKESNNVYNDNSGNIGIGTSHPSTKLEVDGTFKVTGNITAPLKFGNIINNRLLNLWENANNDHQYYGFGINTTVLRYQVDGAISSHVFFAGITSSSSAELMRIQGNGNVGIGISNPQHKLDIQSGATRTGSHPTGRPLYITGTLSPASNGVEIKHADGTQGIGFGYNTIYAAGSNPNQDLGLSAKGTTGHLLFSTNGIERMRITGLGNIGIGTSNPHAPLQFSHDLVHRKIVLYEGADNDHTYYGFGVTGGILRYQVSNQADNHVFYAGVNESSSTELMRIKGNGNVTIAGIIETEVYITPTLLNGFGNYGGDYANVAYYKDKENRVHLHGMANHGSNPLQTIFILPAGYRPSSGRLIFTAGNNNSTARIDILINGEVQIQTGSIGWFSLEGISFRAE